MDDAVADADAAESDDFQVVTAESARADATSEVARWVERSCGDVPILGEGSASPESVRRRIIAAKGRMHIERSTKADRSWGTFFAYSARRAWSSRRAIVFAGQAAVVAVRVMGMLCVASDAMSRF
jgi:hypothetical protein